MSLKDLISLRVPKTPDIQHASDQFIKRYNLKEDYTLYQILMYTYPLSKEENKLFHKLDTKFNKIVEIHYERIPMEQINRHVQRDTSSFYYYLAVQNRNDYLCIPKIKLLKIYNQL